MADSPYILIPTYNKFTPVRQIGEYEYQLPDPPNKKDILNSRIVQANQKITRIIDEKYYYSLTDTKDKLDYYNKIQDYCDDGIWLYNNGNLEYLTGRHFFYLNVYYGDGQYQRWTDSDRDFFYFWDLVEKDSACKGGIVVSCRRWGKSHKAASLALQIATEAAYRKVGMQSKTDNDVYKDLYMKVVNAYRRMPVFLQPISSLGTNPQGGLKFEEPSRRSSKERLAADNIFLNSEIDYRASNEQAYDGAKQHFNIQDEIFKKQKANIEERLKTVAECVFDGGVIGKILAISTVEEIEGEAGQRGEEVWKKADPKNVNELGQTANEFKRYFNPAFYGLRMVDGAKNLKCMDEYGYSLQENAVKYFETQRKLKKGKDLSDIKRKFPFTIKEAFANRTQTNPFDTNKINEQLEWNETHYDLAFKIIRGDFIENGNRVDWFPHEEGRWQFVWLPPENQRNIVARQGIFNVPGNYYDGVIGVDPVAQRSTSGKGSDYAMVVFRKSAQKFDHENKVLMGEDPMSNMPVGIYRCRLPNIDIHHKDTELAARFFGYPIHCEKNAITGLETHMAHSEYYHYLMSRDFKSDSAIPVINDHKGTPNYSPDERLSWLYMVASYIYENCGKNDTTHNYGKIFFKELLEDLRDLEPDDWKPYDLFVAFCYAIQIVKTVRKPKEADVSVQFNIPTYRIEGTRSVRV